MKCDFKWLSINVDKAEKRNSELEDNQVELKQEIQILADFYKTTTQGFAAHCQIKERSVPLIDLTIQAGSREQAEAICQNWKKQNEEVYAYLMDLLLR